MAANVPHASFSTKAYVLVSLIVPTFVAIVLLGLAVSHIYLRPELKQWITDNRAITQIVVQVISMLMGACQIYTVSSVIRFWASTQISNQPMSLDRLKLFDALTTGRLDLEIPFRTVIILVLYLGLIQVPSALWAGALTPVITSTNETAQYNIPSYSNSTSELWTYRCQPDVGCPTEIRGNTTELGTFTYQAWKDKASDLVDSIAVASSMNSSSRQHRKLDNSGYVYQGRSYGVASGIGLAPDPVAGHEGSRKVLTYQYEELGYLTSVNCIYNKTANLTLIDMGNFDNYPDVAWVVPTGYWAGGSLPTGDWAGFPTWSIAFNGTAFAIAAVRNSTNYMYGLVAGGYHGKYNNIQCGISFAPNVFSVDVDIGSRIITVAPQKNSTQTVGWVSREDSITDVAFFETSYLSQMMTTLYWSVMAEAFDTNVDNVKIRNNHTTSTDNDYLTGVSEGLEIVLDHILGNTGATQMMYQNDMQFVPANLVLQVMRIGEPKFIYAVFAICIALALLTAADALRTRFWDSLPQFNSLDLKSAILGIASGASHNDFDLRRELTRWNGDPADRVVGALMVRSSRERPVLIFTREKSYTKLGEHDDISLQALNLDMPISNSPSMSRDSR